MTSPTHKRFEEIIRDTVANEEARRAAWDEAAVEEEMTQAVVRALEERSTQGPLSIREMAEIAVETISEFSTGPIE